MKASKLIELLAKQIADSNCDLEVYFSTEMSAGLPDSEHQVDFEVKSVKTDENNDILIYGEMV